MAGRAPGFACCSSASGAGEFVRLPCGHLVHVACIACPSDRCGRQGEGPGAWPHYDSVVPASEVVAIAERLSESGLLAPADGAGTAAATGFVTAPRPSTCRPAGPR